MIIATIVIFFENLVVIFLKIFTTVVNFLRNITFVNFNIFRVSKSARRTFAKIIVKDVLMRSPVYMASEKSLKSLLPLLLGVRLLLSKKFDF